MKMFKKDKIKEEKKESVKKEKAVISFKKDKTVVPDKKEKVGAEKIVSGKKKSPKEFFKKIGNGIASHKKITGGVCAGIVAVVLVVVLVVALVNKDNSEKTMTAQINDLGKSFYEDFYYDAAGSGDEDERSEFLAKFSDIGIKVSLENLIRYYVTTDDYEKIDGALKDSDVSERITALEKNWFTTDKYKCDADETKVIIYPQDPYGTTDYKLEVVTSCGFDSEKEATEE